MRIGIGALVYLLLGFLIAADHFGVSAGKLILAILAWPLILLGVDIDINIS